LAIDLYVGGEPVSPPGFIYNCRVAERTQSVVNLFDRNSGPWGWRLYLQDLTRLDDMATLPPPENGESYAGWCGITASVCGIDGSLYAPFRPFLFLAQPWVYPTLLVWPDTYVGPVVATLRVVGPITGQTRKTDTP
jgi:hypothetical protein